jgi:hypothetical protein
MVNIPEKYRKATVNDRGNLFTPAGRIMYANLFVPSSPDREDNSQSKLQYGLTLLIPAGYDLSEIEKAVDRTIDEKHKPANATLRAKIKRPILETAGIQSLAALAEEYPYCLRLSAKAYDKNGQKRQRPGVVNAKLEIVDEESAPDECYNGRWARCSVREYPWTHKTGGAGVSLGLNNVQLLAHDDPLAGGKARAEDEFEAVEIDDAEAYE